MAENKKLPPGTYEVVGTFTVKAPKEFAGTTIQYTQSIKEECKNCDEYDFCDIVRSRPEEGICPLLVPLSKPRMRIDTDTVYSCEIFICTCEHCTWRFIMGCSDSQYIKFCPWCGVEVEVLMLNA